MTAVMTEGQLNVAAAILSVVTGVTNVTVAVMKWKETSGHNKALDRLSETLLRQIGSYDRVVAKIQEQMDSLIKALSKMTR